MAVYYFAVAIFGLHSEYEVENHGIAPDFESRMIRVCRGWHDPSNAVQVTLEALKAHPVVILRLQLIRASEK
jgi:hypothetical protein